MVLNFTRLELIIFKKINLKSDKLNYIIVLLSIFFNYLEKDAWNGQGVLASTQNWRGSFSLSVASIDVSGQVCCLSLTLPIHRICGPGASNYLLFSHYRYGRYG